MVVEITESIARRVLDTVDAGLVSGVGKPLPGQMCVEAAVCYALGEPHGDEPSCVAPALRALKIQLNDACWSSDHARAQGMRKLALLQLGSVELDDQVFAKAVAMFVVVKLLPKILRGKIEESLIQACENAKNLGAAARAAARAAAEAAARAAAEAAAEAAAWAARVAEAAAAWAARVAARAAARVAAEVAEVPAAADEILTFFAEGVADILIQMQVPGVVWLPLLESRD